MYWPIFSGHPSTLEGSTVICHPILLLHSTYNCLDIHFATKVENDKIGKDLGKKSFLYDYYDYGTSGRDKVP
jgi:hypothetical protein